MKIIFSSTNLIEVTQLQHLLEDAGIPCLVRNEISSGLAPEIPLTDSTPELWIQEDTQLAEAERIKQEWQAPLPPGGNAWLCSGCGEKSEAQFTHCWKCGTAKT